MNPISMLVVLYNKQIDEAKTLTTLLNFDVSNVDLTIINNGPDVIRGEGDVYLKLKGKSGSIKLINHIDNKPLSKLYNEFIENNNSDVYVIFDDDSEITEEYMRALGNCKKYDLLIPRILSISDDKYYYPCENNNTVMVGKIVSELNVMSISSGLSISARVVKMMIKEFHHVFDERFALYGIDTSFFLRIRRLRRKNIPIDILCAGVLFHSLSRVENKSKYSAFRRIERLYDIALTAKHYPEYISFFAIIKQIIKLSIRFDFKFIILFLSCYISGKHPRC
ncbi:GT2 family glycosyltransferase [Gibbsiella quercinecans]|uniref:Glycosyltransferase 2-like domain-containing protein n=1 Tax=Gibbsiella quercinecans TaxID=929813 RepID=A0A250AXM0_9GAMM|nr:glycosyl transferase [Gibbsiella quercinecans]ATA18621.1 hypothetical protein AWC35_04260 [Gibbsiella quercinecans]RLM14869.1 hypothetical protein BIY30_00020 [Gibbsiella quercinecans]TCT91863.1 GT2 family glycosyltransferase [Gibbsiella quercinecans]